MVRERELRCVCVCEREREREDEIRVRCFDWEIERGKKEVGEREERSIARGIGVSFLSKDN